MKKNTGFIALYRSLQDNPLWLEKPFSKGQAWVDLLLSANHKDNIILLGNIPTPIKRGQFHTSELKLAARWGWSRKKVRAYLRLLETLKMGTTQGTTQGTTLTLANYDDYQVQGTTKGTTEDTAEEHQKNNGGYTNNNDTTMINNDKQIYRGFSPPTIMEVSAYCTERKNNVDAEKWMDHYISNGWMVGKTKMVNWKAAVRTWEKDNAGKSEKPIEPGRTKAREIY